MALMVSSAASPAADHLDGPAVSNDPAADINDLYAFDNPENPDERILAATMVPLARDKSSFSNVVSYNYQR